MKTIIKDALILFVITLVAGVLLGFVYEVTKDAREEQAEIKKNNAYKEVFVDYLGEVDAYKDKDLSGLTFTEYELLSKENLDISLKDAGYGESVVTVDSVAEATLDGVVIGYAVTITSKEGYDGDIQFTVGIMADGTVSGISYLSISETPGLGMNAKEEAFVNKFVGKNGGNFIANKDNVSGLKNEIDAISGATITTRAVIKGVNAAYITVMTITDGGDVNE